jgi:hypothetical protein
VGTTVSISGSGKADVTVFGRGTVIAGNGNDKIDITGNGKIVVGSGNDTLTLGHGGTITENGASGHDTIHIGSTGVYTIVEQGHATVTGAFGQATISGGTLKIVEAPGQAPREIVTGGHVTLIGAGSTGAAAGSGSTHTQGVAGHDTMVGGGSSHDSGSSHNLFNFLQHDSQHLLKNFVAGENHLVIEGHALNYMQNMKDTTLNAGKTMIGMDGGRTTIELHGVTIQGDKH